MKCAKGCSNIVSRDEAEFQIIFLALDFPVCNLAWFEISHKLIQVTQQFFPVAEIAVKVNFDAEVNELGLDGLKKKISDAADEALDEKHKDEESKA